MNYDTRAAEVELLNLAADMASAIVMNKKRVYEVRNKKLRQAIRDALQSAYIAGAEDIKEGRLII